MYASVYLYIYSPLTHIWYDLNRFNLFRGIQIRFCQTLAHQIAHGFNYTGMYKCIADKQQRILY